MQSKYSSIHYNSYLQLDKVTDSQGLRSVELGKPAHDEMLFIITHQVYELWFKQINHELYSIKSFFSDRQINESNIGIAVARIERIIEIFKLLTHQINIMETMTPMDFLDFRNYLFPASGFQSFQFREMEVLLGLKNKKRITYNDKPYHVVFDSEKQEKLKTLENSASLQELIEEWLERTPFLDYGDFNFLEEYRKAVEKMLEEEKTAILSSEILSEETKAMRIRMLGDTNTYFANIMDESKHSALLTNGELSLSYKATIAALFINIYRDEPILHMPYILLSKLIEIDDLLTTWRYRHAQMVMRMLGKKVGTGGSSGHDYLATTAAKHHIFSDLHNISTLLIPRSSVPSLPIELKKSLGFYFSNKI
jgi:tryptophan 2,3-dioxygenase